MTNYKNPTIQALLSGNVDDANKNEICYFSYYLMSPELIIGDKEWPFRDLIKYEKLMSPKTHAEAGTIPTTIAIFLYRDIRRIVVMATRLDYASNCMFEQDIGKYSKVRIGLLYNFMVTFCGCSMTSRRNIYAKKAII